MQNELVAVNILAEDSLCEALAKKLLSLNNTKYSIGVSYIGHGYGYIKEKLVGFNKAAKGVPILALSDLVGNCAPDQIREWLPHGQHANLVFRIAEKESEAWILADSEGVGSFLGVSKKLIPDDVDNIIDPKLFLINLTRKSRNRSLRESLIPRVNSTATIGPNYNPTLTYFVENIWNPCKGGLHSPSLNRAIQALKVYNPIIDN